MIVRILSHGHSFKGAEAYLTHDPDAGTANRVAWTHTHNLANDHVPSAVDEMYWTARNAELLKAEAGIRAGGRSTNHTVKHISLNWSPEARPTREQMIAAAESYLEFMGWREHQAVIVAHNDKPYAHLHILLNMIHPENGLRLNDSFDKRASQRWAKQYEIENGRIFCEQRLLPEDDREKTPPRHVWKAFSENEAEFSEAEKSLRKNHANCDDTVGSTPKSDLEKLQQLQRLERERFFETGKAEFKELRAGIYREIRAEFREGWAQYYDARKNNAFDPVALAALKAGLVENQNAVLKERRDAACLGLRQARDERYRGILGRQGEERSGLRALIADGADTREFMQRFEGTPAYATAYARGQFVSAAQQLTSRAGRPGKAVEKKAGHGRKPEREPKIPVGAVANAIGSPIATLFADLFNLGSARPEPKELEADGRDAYQAAADETTQHASRQTHEREEDERAKRLSLYERER